LADIIAMADGWVHSLIRPREGSSVGAVLKVGAAAGVCWVAAQHGNKFRRALVAAMTV
jgi:hypothetical protein